MRGVLLLLALCAAAPTKAQLRQQSIDPGMRRAEVVDRFGLPVAEQRVEPFTFLFYEADCGPGCELEDVVIFQNDSVADALLLPPYRVYTGESRFEHDLVTGPPPEEPSGVPWSTHSATPLLPTGQPGIPHGRDAALNTPPGIPAGTTTAAGFSVPAPETLAPDDTWMVPYAGAEPAPEDAARLAWLRRHAVVQQLLDEVEPDSLR